MSSDPLEPLWIADPPLARQVEGCLRAKTAAAAAGVLELLVAETLWALAVEIGFGQAVAMAYAEVAGALAPRRLARFSELIRAAGAAGPTRGRIMAECLPAIAAYATEEVLDGFKSLWGVMERKGSHLLRAPLAALGGLLAGGDAGSAAEYLGLLREAFSAELTYAEGRYLAAALPAAALALSPPRRAGQLAALRRVIRADRRLVEPLLAGFDRGLALLSPAALEGFVASALRKYRKSAQLGARHLALESLEARRGFAARQVSVGLTQVHGRLQRYLGARTGLALAVRPLSALPAAAAAALAPGTMVCSDRGAVYLPEEIGWHGRREDNERLYTLLVGLEASFHEFGTVDFDLEKAAGRGAVAPAAEDAGARDGGGDIGRFLAGFADEGLAADLFTLFELTRVRRRLEQDYPGLVRRGLPLLRQAAARQASRGAGGALLAGLLERLVLTPAGAGRGPAGGPPDAASRLAAAISPAIGARHPVEASAELTARWFAPVAAEIDPADRGRLKTPFGWRPWAHAAAAEAGPHAAAAAALQAALAARGLRAYKADIRRLLAQNAGRLAAEDLRGVCGAPVPADLPLAEILGLPAAGEVAADHTRQEGGPAFRYPEWDVRLLDYLPDHVLVRERPVAGGEPGFYARVAERRHGLIAATRRAFECLRPEGLTRLRPWRDGDELDLGSLVAAAVDRRAGNPAPDRLYVKRVKGARDVAVLVLVDVSRSTAQRVAGGAGAVLDVEKEAIVVLCEALAVVGDAYAVAGFSGSGRLGVDYCPLKGFAEPLSDAVKERIGALSPQRNTRMGAAIRHAGRHLDRVAARVRLLLVLGDGFPNDQDYKQEYAIADTHRALCELQARRIRTHALTVNLATDPKLDALFGRLRHQVIGDLRELPDRLVRVYGALTR
jgi:hypothetical protein